MAETGGSVGIKMNAAATEAKAALRRAIRARLGALPATVRSAASSRVCTRLQNDRVWQEAGTVLLYASAGDELDVWPLVRETLARGKVLGLPRFDAERSEYSACQITNLDRDLQPGRFGIREPGSACQVIATNRLDLVVVPGVAFTLDGQRLGRGKGFYDRILAAVRGVKCGVGFDEQIVDAIPTEPHDMLMDCILTPTHWRCLDQGAVLR